MLARPGRAAGARPRALWLWWRMHEALCPDFGGSGVPLHDTKATNDTNEANRQGQRRATGAVDRLPAELQ